MKSFIYKFFLSGSLLATLATACSTDDFSLSGDKTAAKITASMGLASTKGATRASDNVWGKSDHIGITMLEYPITGAPVVVNSYSNQDFVTTDGDGNFSSNPSSNIMYYPVDGSAVTFKAYYPYNSAMAAGNFIMPVNVSDQTNLAALDLMTADHTNADLSVSNTKDNPNVNLKFYHRLSKVSINLTADSPIDLTGCKLVLKGMLTKESYNLMNDTRVLDNTSGANIEIPVNNLVGTGILLPRSAGAGITFQVTTANGAVYTATMDNSLELKSGYKYTFNVRLSTTPVMVSATVTPWTDGPTQNMTLRIGTANLGSNSGLINLEELYLYQGDNSNRTSLAGHFVYNLPGNVWNYSESTPLYWESISGSKIYASIIRKAVNPLLSNQSPDYITATPIDNDGGKSNTALNFNMTHQVAQVQVALSSSIYTDAQLQTAVVSLPNYKVGGTLNNGIYVPGTATGDIAMDGPNSSKMTSAYLQPQSIGSSATLVKVKIGTREYIATGYTVGYEAGKVTKLNIDIQPSEVKVSVSVKPWEDQTPVAIRFFFTESQTNISGFINGDQIKFYKMNSPVSSGVSSDYNQSTYTVSGTNVSLTNWTKTWYRDDLQAGNQFVGVFPVTVGTNVATNGTTFNWICKGDNAGSATTNAHQDDVVISQLTPSANNTSTGLVVSGSANVSFYFLHVLSKITVNIYPGDGFTLSELQTAANASTPTLYPVIKGFIMDGTVNVTTAKVSALGSTIVSNGFRPSMLGSTPNGAAASYEALIMPQTIIGKNFIDIVLDGHTYNAQADNSSSLFNAGQNHIFNIYLKKTGILLSTSVAPWTDNSGGSITIQ